RDSHSDCHSPSSSCSVDLCFPREQSEQWRRHGRIRLRRSWAPLEAESEKETVQGRTGRVCLCQATSDRGNNGCVHAPAEPQHVVSHSSAPSPLSVAGPLNITAVTTCPSTNACCPDELRTRGVSSSQVSPSHEESPLPHHARVLTPPASFETSTRPGRQQPRGSPLTEGLDLASPASQHPVHISVTPATPPSSESSGSLSQEDCEPMEQSSLLPRWVGQRRGVVQEDLSSDSSDSEM
ncbi:hypothetical protein GBAR_LOCUS31533, partial [Geodia barretti]